MDLLSQAWAIVLQPEWRLWVGGVFCLIGGVSTVIASVGVLRFPDFYTRLHAASVTDTLGALTLLFGMALMAPTLPVLIKLVLIGLFLVFTSPTSSHAIANAAYTAGEKPLIGDVKAQLDDDEEGNA